jgi:hypothetical protein
LKEKSMATGPWSKIRLTASGVAISGPCEFGGVICQVAGTTTTVTVYDATSASANDMVVASTSLAAANDFVAPTKAVGGSGLQHKNGIYVTIGGTGSPAVWILYR